MDSEVFGEHLAPSTFAAPHGTKKAVEAKGIVVHVCLLPFSVFLLLASIWQFLGSICTAKAAYHNKEFSLRLDLFF